MRARNEYTVTDTTANQFANIGAINELDAEIIDLSTPCLPWQSGTVAQGYGILGWRGKRRYIHRVAYAASRGVPLESLASLCVRHLCNRKDCWNFQHLAAGKAQHNSDDMKLAGRQAKGERINTCKLTADIVQACRTVFVNRSKTHGAQALARQHGVSTFAMWSALTGKTWRHVPGAHSGYRRDRTG
jgi:hypothetical protein